MALTIKAPNSKSSATKDITNLEKGKVVSSSSEPIDPEINSAVTGDPEPWAQVGIEAGYTHNLGDFRSCRISISLTLPCRLEEIDQVYEVGKAWVEERMNTAVEEMTS